MSLTRDTSRFYQYWLDNVEPDLKETKEAIAQKISSVWVKLLKLMVYACMQLIWEHNLHLHSTRKL